MLHLLEAARLIFDVSFSVNNLGVKVEKLITGLELGGTFLGNVLLVVEDIEPLEKGIICSSLEEKEDTVPLKEGVGCSSFEEGVSTVGAAASANNLWIPICAALIA
jgi:translation initiation factor 2 gamma subunit (eIF-2gamma)